MSEAALLRQFEDKAQQVRAECDRLLADVVPADAPWRPLVEAVSAAARTVEQNALAPVKIGVVGEFSAGKTLLLGSLIGYADALPVSELPTTGNVTALNFTLVDELVTTQVGPYHIQFLDHDGFKECLGYMLAQARRRAKQAELREELCDQLAAIDAADPAAASKIEAWGRSAWAASTNPSLRYLIRESVGYVRAYAKCGTGLCEGGEAFEVDADTARRGLELPQDREGIQGLDFGDLPAPSGAIPSRPEHLAAYQIRDAFPLVRLVSVDVTVSKQVWDFSSLTGANRFSLMDFPGLGSDASGVRDLFLCLRELEQIQTILILLNGRRPGGNEGSRLYDLLQEHRPKQDIRHMILVAVGRFDELPLKNEGGEEKLRQLAGTPAIPSAPTPAASKGKAKPQMFTDDEDDAPPPAKSSGGTGPLTEAAVTGELPVLATCVAGAVSLVPADRKDRVVLVSPLLHLRFLEEKNVGVRVASEAYLSGNREAADKAVAAAKLWAGVANRLKAMTPGGRAATGLTRWLDDFATDGGIGQLRTQIHSHVQAHGLAQRFTDVSRDVKAMRTALEELRAALPADALKDTRTDGDKLHAAEKELRALVDVYQDVAHRLAAPRFTVTRNDQPVPLDEVLQDEIISQVCEWPEWDALWQRVQHGYIVEKASTSVFTDDDEGGEAVAVGFPTRSEDFFAPFERTVKSLSDFTRVLIDQGVDEWLDKLREPTAAAQLSLAGPLDRKTLPSEIAALRLGDRAAGMAKALRAAVNPQRLKKLLFPPDGDLAGLDLPEPTAAAVFPLARSTKDAAGRVFAWAKTVAAAPEGSRPERHHAHQAMLLRVRDEVINVLRLEMAQLLSQSVKIAVDKFLLGLNEMIGKLSVAASNRFLLEVILTDPSATPAAEADAGDSPAAQARRLAAVAI